ncbi:hypothetical protein B0T25DRAFT_611615 [Lasiosphaeria hispida]|uniref:Uncharacterized protein n=1 Tax=Lasiosphaeria hispida TaxID=260671 RepID=A0AAJ0MDA2_9PEZI|nr:hypothetical protein B0T25DRAFT_611615 [Lasiosphaeria hispida]
MPHLDLWYDFGFAICTSLHAESTLVNMYKDLLLDNQPPLHSYYSSLGSMSYTPPDYPTCPFAAFWRAWEAGTLMSLFDRYGTHRGAWPYRATLDLHLLRCFLPYPGKPPLRPSVKLRQFLPIEGANVLTCAPDVADATIEYRFHPLLDTRVRLDLHGFYTRVFERGTHPDVVDGAMREGRLHEEAEAWSGREVDERVKRALEEYPSINTIIVPNGEESWFLT